MQVPYYAIRRIKDKSTEAMYLGKGRKGYFLWVDDLKDSRLITGTYAHAGMMRGLKEAVQVIETFLGDATAWDEYKVIKLKEAANG